MWQEKQMKMQQDDCKLKNSEAVKSDEETEGRFIGATLSWST
jgi:hypothetical protein